MAPYIPVAAEGFLNGGRRLGGVQLASEAAALIASLVRKSIETAFGAAAATLSQHGLRVIDDTCYTLKSNTCSSSSILEMGLTGIY